MSVLLRRAIATYLKERKNELRATSQSTFRVVLNGFCNDIGDLPTDRITKHHVRQWWIGMGVSPRTARSRLSVVRNFCRWCVEKGWMKTDPTFGIRSPKVPSTLPVILNREQIGSVIEACPTDRERVIVLLMLQLGLRAAEVAGLRTGDVDLAAMQLRVRGKGGHEAVLPIPRELEVVLVPWLSQIKDTGPVIRRLHGSSWAPLAPATVGVVVKEAMVAAGVKHRRGDGISGHALRRTAITDVARNGAPLPSLQGFSRHLAVGSLRPYLRVTAAEELRDHIDRRRYLPDA